MRKVKLHRIVRIVPLPAMNVFVQFEDGRVVIADLTAVADRGGVFARLREESYFNKARLTNAGRAIGWPDRLDFCADAFYVAQARTRSRKPTTNAFGAKIFAPTIEVVAA